MMTMQNVECRRKKDGEFGGCRMKGRGSFEAPSVQAPSPREIPTSKVQSHRSQDLQRENFAGFRIFEVFRLKLGICSGTEPSINVNVGTEAASPDAGCTKITIITLIYAIYTILRRDSGGKEQSGEIPSSKLQTPKKFQIPSSKPGVALRPTQSKWVQVGSDQNGLTRTYTDLHGHTRTYTDLHGLTPDQSGGAVRTFLRLCLFAVFKLMVSL